MKATKAGCVLATVLVAASAAHADTRSTERESLERFAPYVQAPVENFTYWSLYKWKPLGPDKVIVWSTVKDAFLLTVQQPCPRLEWTHGIGLTARQSHQVNRRIDYVTAGGDRCRIIEIQPIDTARMAADRTTHR